MSSILYILIFFIFFHVNTNSTRLIHPILSLSIVRGTSSSRRDENTQEAIMSSDDDYGSGYLDTVKVINEALDHANTIVVMKCMNGTLISYGKDSNTSTLLLSTISPIHHISNTPIVIVITGMIEDYNYIKKSIDLFTINYFRDFDQYPTSYQISLEIAKILRKSAVSSGSRFLIVHAVVIDVRKINTIYDIDASGLVSEADYVVAGKNTLFGQKELASRYSLNISTSDAQDIAKHVILHQDIRKTFLEDESGPKSMKILSVIHKLIL